MDWQYHVVAWLFAIVEYSEFPDPPGYSPLAHFLVAVLVAYLFVYLFYRAVCRYESWASAADDFAAELYG